jgi:signal transduction histidine kinase
MRTRVPRDKPNAGLDNSEVARRAAHAVSDAGHRDLAGLGRRPNPQHGDALTAGIAHDLNNFLQVIGNSLELLDRRETQDPAARRLNGVARQALERATKLSRQLFTLSQGHEWQLEVVCIEDLRTTMGDILRRALPDTIRLEMHRAPHLWSCMTDVCMLEASVLNLAINARDAMPEGGTLTIDLVNRAIDGKQAAAAGLRKGDFVVASVADTGSGMEPSIMARAFEAFFTTKEVGKGTGLGLSQVQAFAKRCNGYATIASELGRGTQVLIYLPRAD